MASTFFGLTIAYTGLQAAQTSINVTSHNLANINTKGYTRESASTKAADALRTMQDMEHSVQELLLMQSTRQEIPTMMRSTEIIILIMDSIMLRTVICHR